MQKPNDRRKFLKNAAVAGLGLGFSGTTSGAGTATRTNTLLPPGTILKEGKIGMIGLDTSHCMAFATSLNDPKGKPGLWGFTVVAAYPQGSKDIESSASRIPGITAEIKNIGVEIVDSIDSLLKKVDVVLLETNDGRLHLEQALLVLKAGKRLFIDKPIAHSLADAIAIFEASKKYNTPVFSSSSLRYTPGIQDIAAGNRVGKVLGAEAFSPCHLEKTHGDLFWYGIHGVETLFTVMGRGCKKIVRINTDDTDLVAGTWDNNRIGTFRGLRSGNEGFGGTVFGEKGIASLPDYAGYDPLLIEIVHFFRTGISPVDPQETIEICAFMEAADESKRNGGSSVSLESMLKKAKA